MGVNVEDKNGNYRELQKGFNADVFFVSSEAIRLAAASFISFITYIQFAWQFNIKFFK